MKALATGIVFVFAASFASPALADETAEAPKTVEANSGKVVVVLEGKPAPFSGILVPEERFKAFLKAELAVEELRGKLDIRTREMHNIEQVYRARLEEATKPPPWYESPGFNRWLGIGIGVAITVGAIYAGSQVTR